MQDYQTQLIQLALAQQALRFGNFTLKSGLQSPYFFNIGQIHHGAGLQTLAHCYAAFIQSHHERLGPFDILYGPAYKGIPLATATAMALFSEFKQDVQIAFNRKEAKTHGEGGVHIGAPLAQKRVLLIDDVITQGTAIKASIEALIAASAIPVGIVVALDRQEPARPDPQNSPGYTAQQKLAAQYNIPILSIITRKDLVAYTKTHPEFQAVYQALQSH
jgi:orotate phosphoribosyltransferase